MSALLSGRSGPGRAGEPWTAANHITVARTVLAVTLGAVAAGTGSLPLLSCGFAAYWSGDVLDGWVARRTGTETRQGAVLDIGCDRVCCGVLVTTYAALVPATAAALGVFLLQFLVVDGLLSLSFLRWPILSPNYFWQVDARLYRLNWSPAAKATNTALLVVLVAAGLHAVAVAVAVLQLGLKTWSLAAVRRLPS